MKTKRINKKAISLIVLVITIIVMIILAGAIIISLNNSGIIGKANEAVDKTNEANLKQLASLLWAEAYADGARTQEELDTVVKEGLQDQNISLEDYYVEVTTSGVEVGKRVWKQVGLTVTDGKQVLNIGDTVAYDETNNGAITHLTATDWKVLGASDKGELLIMSTNDIVEDYYLGNEDDIEGAEALAESQKDYATGVQQLNDLCVPYKDGKGAAGARSITVEDVNKITGYDPETAKYGKGELHQYGNEVTYYWDGTDKPVYKSSVVNGSLLGNAHNLFMWYDETTNAWVTSQKSTTATTITPELITATNNSSIVAKLKNTAYYYYALEDTTLDTESDAFKMLFGEDEDSYYWLASSCVKAGTSYVSFGMRYVSGGSVDFYNFVYSNDGGYDYDYYGVRAVVTLTSDIQFAGSSAEGWSY